MGVKPYIKDEIYSFNNQNQTSQSSSKVDENIEHVNTELMEELKTKI